MEDNKRKRSIFIPSTDVAGVLLPNNTFGFVDIPHNSPFEVGMSSSRGVYEFRAVILPPTAILIPKETDWFILEEPVDELQKQGNNRYDYSIHPTPLIILLKNAENAKEIVNGKVTVKLVSEDGKPILNPSKILRGNQSGVLDMDKECSVSFDLQTMNLNSEPRKLEFTIEADTKEEGSIKQTIYSSVFSVYDKNHDAWNTPLIVRINPVEQKIDDRSFICLVGYRFSMEKITVLFGEKEARIIEVSPTLLVCQPPVMDGPLEVEVIVVNTHIGSSPVKFKYL